LSDRRLRRAGADYWADLDLIVHDNLPAFFRETPPEACFYFSRKAARSFADMTWIGSDPLYLLFGRESVGLPEDLLAAHPGRAFRIPMRAGARSLNVSNAAAIVLYEALRQRGFPGLE
jgi:tRNA (cytidine/uridine-2'-O-)-methyltransferase